MTSSVERVQGNKFLRAASQHPLWQFLRGFVKNRKGHPDRVRRAEKEPLDDGPGGSAGRF